MLPIAMGENGCNANAAVAWPEGKLVFIPLRDFGLLKNVSEKLPNGAMSEGRSRRVATFNDGAVGVGFPGEQRGPLRVARGAESPHHQKERGNDGRFCRGDASGEKVVKALESPRAPEVRRVVGVGGDECRRHSRYQERGQPVPSLPELHRKQPDVFLILKNVVRERAPGDVALRSS